MNIIKRNGEEVKFDAKKIIQAISKANNDVKEDDRLSEFEIKEIAEHINSTCKLMKRALSVDEIQNLVEKEIMKANKYNLAREYITYRYKRELLRKSNTTDDKILSLISNNNEDIKQENSNKNPTVVSVQRDYMAGEVSKDLCKRLLFPKDLIDAHEKGLIHIHDMDYIVSPITNCCLVNLEDMLQNGTVISGTMIEKPHSFYTACNITTQIIAQVASSQFGGQSITLTHLAPFVDISRKKIQEEVRDEVKEFNATEEQIKAIVEKRLKKEIERGVQTIQYQVNTLMTTNGQAPFISVFMYLNETQDIQTKKDLALIIEEVLNQRIVGVKNEKGVYITPAFPKLIYVLEEDNIKEDSPYFYLTQLAAKCTAKRMVPDYVSEKVMKELKVSEDGTRSCYAPMGCRSFLTPDRTMSLGNIANSKNYIENRPKYWGRFNQGVCTLNLVDVALSSEGEVGNKSLNSFWKLLEERAELCHRALRLRHEHLLNTKSDVAPILWQNGALARLSKGETIDKLLYNGYSTISLGYAGLWECVKALTGYKLTTQEGQNIGLKIMQKLNDFTNRWKKDENIDYSIYGSPLESTTYKYAKCLQERFGIIRDITDKNYITNSYHIKVTEPIDAFNKLAIESKFQELSPGGAISYVEVPNLTGNPQAVLRVMQFIYNNIMYAELNTKSDFCQVCGYDGEIKIIEDENNKLIWECPNCHNREQSKMNIARRTCGYIGTNYWNQGRTQEIKDRALHL